MKALLILLFFSVLICVQDSSIVSSYDRSKDTTTIITKLANAELINELPIQSVGFTASVTHRGRELHEVPITVLLTFLVSSEKWQFANNRKPEISVAVDGKRLLERRGTFSGSKVFNHFVMEMVTVELPVSIISQIADAKLTEIQIGTVQLKLARSNVNALKELLAAIKG